MKQVTTLPEEVRHIEHAWIPLSDGTKLAARIWIPESAQREPVPAVLEYIPYRKRDGTRLRDDTMHPYFAGHGYACLRVDLRGSGDSEGVLTDEYLPQELDDGIEVIRWIASQPWCSGAVGMIGISWGGFNGLQIAARQPPQLKAIVSVCSTDDRYADDVHYMGGCLLGDNLSWASTMFAYNSLPPDPAIVGDRWRDLWRQRLEGSGLWLEKWLEHPRRDAYWQHGSICEDYARVSIPVMAVSGWADGYSNAVFRLLRHLPGPRMGLIGPWSHRYPHLGVPGPAIGFLQEALRWWDHWLKGIETGIGAEPMLRAWMLESMPPTTSYAQRYGRWISEPTWPSPAVEECLFFLGADELRTEPSETPSSAKTRAPSIQTVQSPLGLGLFAGKWCSYSAIPDLPHDQRQEDGGALTFTSQPLTERLEILGAPILDLTLRSNRPVAMVAVRLNDVQPDDKATRVTYGLLNLTHRKGHDEPEPLEPGETYHVSVRMNEIAQRFPPGNRIRISISTSYFPLAWPPPEPVRLTILPEESRLTLPVRIHHEEEETIVFAEAEGAPQGGMQRISEERHDWRVIRDLASDRSTLEVIDDRGSYRLEEPDLVVQRTAEEWYSCAGDDFSSPCGETRWTRGVARGDWSVRIRTRTVLTCDATSFHLLAELDAHEGEKRVHSENWDRRIPRDLL